MRIPPRRCATYTFAAVLAAFSAGCGGGSSGGASGLPQLAAAKPASLAGSCSDLATKISYADTTITSATSVAAGTTVGGIAAPAHCLVTGKMFQRVSPVDGQSYA